MYHENQKVCGKYINLSVSTVQVFQMIEETAEVDKMSRQKDLLIMERKTFLDNLANISYNDQLSRQVGLLIQVKATG